MKRNRLLFIIAISIAIIACTEDEKKDTIVEPPTPNWTNNCSDETIGSGQTVILTTDYQTTNPNVLITWFDDTTRLNSLPRSHNDYTWTAGKVGVHNIKAVITDRYQIIEVKKSFNVVQCDFDKLIIGDKRSKVIRTMGTSYRTWGDNLTYGPDNNAILCYFDSKDDDAILYLIFNEHKYNWVTYENTTGYYLALGSFQSAYEKAQRKCGDPIEAVIPEAKELDEYVTEGILFYKGEKHYNAKFKLRDKHKYEIRLDGNVYKNSYWSVNGETVNKPKDYIVVTSINI